MIPYSRPNALIYIPYPRVNCLKTIPFTAAHTYIAHIWQYPPPGINPLHVCKQNGKEKFGYFPSIQQLFFLFHWKMPSKQNRDSLNFRILDEGQREVTIDNSLASRFKVDPRQVLVILNGKDINNSITPL